MMCHRQASMSQPCKTDSYFQGGVDIMVPVTITHVSGRGRRRPNVKRVVL